MGSGAWEKVPTSLSLAENIGIWGDLQANHNVVITGKLELGENKKGLFLTLILSANQPALGDVGTNVAVVAGHWPSDSHKTFLGLMLWLLHKLDDDLSAAEFLARSDTLLGS
jgi:hypothetical protein